MAKNKRLSFKKKKSQRKGRKNYRGGRLYTRDPLTIDGMPIPERVKISNVLIESAAKRFGPNKFNVFDRAYQSPPHLDTPLYKIYPRKNPRNGNKFDESIVEREATGQAYHDEKKRKQEIETKMMGQENKLSKESSKTLTSDSNAQDSEAPGEQESSDARLDLLQNIINQINTIENLDKTLQDILEKCEVIIKKLNQSEPANKGEIIKRLFNILMSNIYLPHVEDNSLFQLDSNNVIPPKTRKRLNTRYEKYKEIKETFAIPLRIIGGGRVNHETSGQALKTLRVELNKGNLEFYDLFNYINDSKHIYHLSDFIFINEVGDQTTSELLLTLYTAKTFENQMILFELEQIIKSENRDILYEPKQQFDLGDFIKDSSNPQQLEESQNEKNRKYAEIVKRTIYILDQKFGNQTNDTDKENVNKELVEAFIKKIFKSKKSLEQVNSYQDFISKVLIRSFKNLPTNAADDVDDEDYDKSTNNEGQLEKKMDIVFEEAIGRGQLLIGTSGDKTVEQEYGKILTDDDKNDTNLEHIYENQAKFLHSKIIEKMEDIMNKGITKDKNFNIHKLNILKLIKEQTLLYMHNEALGKYKKVIDKCIEVINKDESTGKDVKMGKGLSYLMYHMVEFCVSYYAANYYFDITPKPQGSELDMKTTIIGNKTKKEGNKTKRDVINGFIEKFKKLLIYSSGKDPIHHHYVAPSWVINTGNKKMEHDEIVVDYLTALDNLSHLRDYMDEVYKNKNLKNIKTIQLLKFLFDEIYKTIEQIGESQTVGQNVNLVFVDNHKQLLHGLIPIFEKLKKIFPFLKNFTKLENAVPKLNTAFDKFNEYLEEKDIAYQSNVNTKLQALQFKDLSEKLIGEYAINKIRNYFNDNNPDTYDENENNVPRILLRYLRDLFVFCINLDDKYHNLYFFFNYVIKINKTLENSNSEDEKINKVFDELKKNISELLEKCQTALRPFYRPKEFLKDYTRRYNTYIFGPDPKDETRKTYDSINAYIDKKPKSNIENIDLGKIKLEHTDFRQIIDGEDEETYNPRVLDEAVEAVEKAAEKAAEALNKFEKDTSTKLFESTIRSLDPKESIENIGKTPSTPSNRKKLVPMSEEGQVQPTEKNAKKSQQNEHILVQPINYSNLGPVRLKRTMDQKDLNNLRTTLRLQENDHRDRAERLNETVATVNNYYMEMATGQMREALPRSDERTSSTAATVKRSSHNTTRSKNAPKKVQGEFTKRYMRNLKKVNSRKYTPGSIMSGETRRSNIKNFGAKGGKKLPRHLRNTRNHKSKKNTTRKFRK